VSPLNIFLDDGGVITDKERRAAEFARLVGDCFVPLLGGTEEAWNRCAGYMEYPFQNRATLMDLPISFRVI